MLNLRAKLDASGYYDDFEVERVVAVELDHYVFGKTKQSALGAALEPVADRLMKRYKAAQESLRTAQIEGNSTEAGVANDQLEALSLFKADMGSYVRLYTFLSQIFDYGNTGIEKRAIFFRRLLPLIDFGREREGVDLSKVVLTHHHLKTRGTQDMSLNKGEAPKLPPIGEAGSGMVRERERTCSRSSRR